MGDVLVSVKEGDTLEILVDWIVKDGKVFLSQYDLLKNDEKEIYCLPMTEIGQEYVISLLEIDNKNTLEILENNYPEVGTRLGSFTSYPMFSVDFSEIKGLNEYKITATWPFMYTTIYEWYIKDKVSTESIETKLYEFFDFASYKINQVLSRNFRSFFLSFIKNKVDFTKYILQKSTVHTHKIL